MLKCAPTVTDLVCWEGEAFVLASGPVDRVVLAPFGVGEREGDEVDLHRVSFNIIPNGPDRPPRGPPLDSIATPP